MSPLGGRSGDGHGALLVGLSLYTVMTAWLLRLPCRVPGWGAEASLPALCATGLAPGEPEGAGGFFTGGPAGDRPALVGMITTVVGRLAAPLTAPSGAGADRDVFTDLSVLLLALVWIGTVAVVSGLSGRRGADAFVLALAPVAVLVGFSTWDLLAVLLMMLALLLHVRGSPAPAGIVLGLAASVALFPLVVLLAVLLLAVRYRQFRDFAVVLAGTVLTWALVNGPFLLSARDRWARQYSTPGEEPVAASSLWGVWARVEQARTGAAPDPAGGGQYVLLALVLGFVAVLVLTLLTRQEPSVVQIAFLLLAVLVLAGPGYSLVHVLWLAPLVVLSRRSWPEFAAWQLVEVLWWTTLVLPEPAWPVLPGLGPIGWDAQDLLAAVRVLLLVLLVVAVAVDVLRGGRAGRIGLSEPD
ncbi:glycosyltransferase 87 family protein [Kocuria sp. M4R2S49]|uniref:glycosyltransferase 87 family protein n=1 Tax=Kocuria rhizosphaericola TaxID=3376284 RepID=UPI0037A1077D